MPLLSEVTCCETYTNRGSKCRPPTNECLYGNSRGEAFYTAQTGQTCSQLVDNDQTTGVQIEQSSDSGGNAALVYSCSQGFFTGTAGEVKYATFCPDSCVKNPSCRNNEDKNDFMVSAFGFPCADYASFGYCAQSLTTDTLPTWWDSMMAAVCPNTCNNYIFVGGVARRALKAQKLEGMAEANTTKLNTMPLIANFTFRASPH